MRSLQGCLCAESPNITTDAEFGNLADHAVANDSRISLKRKFCSADEQSHAVLQLIAGFVMNT